MTGSEVLSRFQEWYGPQEGLKVYMTVMPGILSDFTGMLEKRPGERLREEYRLEDGKGTLVLCGCKMRGRDAQVEFSVIDGIPGGK